MPKQSKKDLQVILEDTQRENRALEQRISNMEARFNVMQSGAMTPPSVSIPLDVSPSSSTSSHIPTNSLMAATAKIIQDTSSVEKNSPFLSNVDEASWKVFLLSIFLIDKKVALSQPEIYSLQK